MKKVVIAIALVLLLIACGARTTGKRITQSNPITGAVPAEPQISNPQVQSADTRRAAEVLDDFKSNPSKPVTSTGAKSGTFYPPIKVTGTGKDALKERTRALMSSGAEVPGNVDAETDFGSKYYKDGGEPMNLPGDYGKKEAVG